MNSTLRLLTLIFFLFISFGACSTQEPGHALKVMSFNVHFDNPADEKNAWPNRIPLIENFMQNGMPDITLFSHVSDLARRKSMEFLSLQIKEIAHNEPVVLMGDFNIAKGSGLYTDMVSHLQSQNKLHNAEYISEATPAATETTFNGFRKEKEPVVIDFIFVNESFGVKQFSVDKVIENEIFISDHWPVKAILSLQ